NGKSEKAKILLEKAYRKKPESLKFFWAGG
ncbi:unnamed protein product, partial [marine sediment metagenome]